MLKQDSIPPSRKFVFYSVVSILFFLKLWTTQYQDTSLSGAGHDQAWYVTKAEHGYWNIYNYSEIAYMKEPLFPLYIALLNRLGIPLRLGNDMAYGIALIFLSATFFMRTRVVWASLVLYALLLFHPHGLSVFTRTNPDALYAILTVLWLTPLVFILQAQDHAIKFWLLGWSVIGGLMVITRPEAIWIYVISFLVMLWTIYGSLKLYAWDIRNPLFLKKTGMLMLVLWIPCLGIVQTIKWINLSRAGFYAVSEQSEPHFQRALKMLMTVKPAKPLRYAFIQMETLARLSEHSPAVAEVYGKLSGPIGRSWANEAQPEYHPGDGEIDGGHIQWAFREAVGSLGYYSSPEAAQAFYDQISEEVNALFESGKFDRRWIPIPALGDDYSPFNLRYLSSLKQILMRSWFLIFHTTEDDKQIQQRTVDIYTTMTLRTRVSYQNRHQANSQLSVKGWVYSQSNPVRVTSIEGRMGMEKVGLATEIQERADVMAAFNSELIGKHDAMFGYLFSSEDKRTLDMLSFRFEDGSVLEAPLSEFLTKTGGHSFKASSNTGQEFVVFVDDTTSSIYGKRLDQVESFIGFYRGLSKLFPYMLILCLIVSGVTIYQFKNQIGLDQCIAASIFLCIPLVRLGMLALIDMSAFRGDDIRYVFPISVCLYAFPFLMYASLKCLRNSGYRQTAPSRAVR